MNYWNFYVNWNNLPFLKQKHNLYSFYVKLKIMIIFINYIFLNKKKKKKINYLLISIVYIDFIVLKFNYKNIFLKYL